MSASASEHTAQCTPTRRQVQQSALGRLGEIRAKLVHESFTNGFHSGEPTQEHGRPTISDQELAALGIRKLLDIDVDETAPFDPEPLFFSPYPHDKVDGFPAHVHKAMGDRTYPESKEWKPACAKPSCSGGCRDLHGDSSKRLGWFLYTIRPGRMLGIIADTDWHLRHYPTCDDECCPDAPIHYQQWGDRHIAHEYHTQTFFAVCKGRRPLRPWQSWPERQSLPHMAVAVWDTTRQSSDTLCSEVVAATHAINYVLRHGRFADHHTIPVLVYSFHHEEFARITQAHWDGHVLTIRHSRLLDLRGPEPTSDAYLLLRWMANTPRGLTAYDLPESGDPHSHNMPGVQPPVARKAVGVPA